jgi:hypothetical protein
MAKPFPPMNQMLQIRIALMSLSFLALFKTKCLENHSENQKFVLERMVLGRNPATSLPHYII